MWKESHATNHKRALMGKKRKRILRQNGKIQLQWDSAQPVFCVCFDCCNKFYARQKIVTFPRALLYSRTDQRWTNACRLSKKKTHGTELDEANFSLVRKFGLVTQRCLLEEDCVESRLTKKRGAGLERFVWDRVLSKAKGAKMQPGPR